MEQDKARAVIRFTDYIVESTHNFTGREWIFQAINDWLADPEAARFFLLTGEPGSGKTAIASRLSQFSQSTVPPPAGLPYLTPNFLSAIHLCSARDSRWINPNIFAASLAMQLAERYPAFARALAEKSGERQIRIEVRQHIEQGQAIGVVINQLDASGIAAEDAFNRVVREPLEALFQEGFDQQVIIMVDALDEALSYSGNISIISLLASISNLPAPVRFLLTSRSDTRVGNAFLDADELVLSAAEYSQLSQNDLRRYVTARLRDDNELAKKTEQMEPAYSDNWVEAILYKAEENFQYVRFLLDAMTKGLRPITELNRLPEGLDELYFDSLQRIVRLGKRDWLNEYAPIMGVLSVAQEYLTLEHLQAFTHLPASSLWKYLDDLQQFIEVVKPQDDAEQGRTRYRLFHQSVSDFLRRQSLFLRKGKEKRNSFYVSEVEWHKKLIDACGERGLDSIWQDRQQNSVEQERRIYARRFYITHLYRAQEWDRLFAVLDEGGYGHKKIQYDPSMRLYTADLDLGRQAAVWDGWTLEEGVALLPRLWRYMLLRCSLASRADAYPPTAFQILVVLGREQEALDLAALLNEPIHKTFVLMTIVQQLAAQANRKQECLPLLERIYEDASAEKDYVRGRVTADLGGVFASLGEWERAEEMWAEAGAIADRLQRQREFGRESVLQKLCVAYAEASLFERAEAIAPMVGLDGQWALNSLCIALAQAGQWERAEAVVRMIDITFWKVKALGELGKELAQAGLVEKAEETWHEAERVLATIDDLPADDKVWASGELGKSFAEAGQQTRALMTWDDAYYSIYRCEERSRVLSELSIAMARARQWARSLAMLSMVKLDDWRVKAQCVLCEEFIEAGELSEATKLWKEVQKTIARLGEEGEETGKLNWVRAHALGELCRALTRAEHWEEAQTIADAITPASLKAQVLGELGLALARAQHWGKAEKVWLEIERVTKTIEGWNLQADAWSGLGRILVQAGLWERAERSVRKIEDAWARERALNELCIRLAQAGQWKRAEEILEKIGTTLERPGALCELSKALARIGQYERAEAAAEVIEKLRPQVQTQPQDLWQRSFLMNIDVHGADALCELSKTLVRVGNTARASTTAQKIKQHDRKAEALTELALTLARAGKEQQAEEVWAQAWQVVDSLAQSLQKTKALTQLGNALTRAGKGQQAEEVWREAERVLGKPGYPLMRSELLRQLSIALAQAQQWTQAERVAHRVEERDERIKALCGLAMALSESGTPEMLLHFVQRCWLQIDTSEYAMQLLPLACGLIPLKLAIGTAFYEGFAWVDAFLRE